MKSVVKAVLAAKAPAFLVLGLGFFSCGGGGGISPAGGGIPQAEACQQAATAVCTKMFGCTDASIAIVRAILMTEANCETTVLAQCGSTGFSCSAGAPYHGDQAQVCKDKFNAESCATLNAALSSGGASTSAAIAAITGSIPECKAICSGGADAGGGG